jgi:chitinase
MEPEEVPVNDISHLNFAFGYINPGDFKITNMDDVKPDLFKKITGLKSVNPSLKVQIALGGWTFTDPGKWRDVFSDMVASSAKGKHSLKTFSAFSVRMDSMAWISTGSIQVRVTEVGNLPTVSNLPRC